MNSGMRLIGSPTSPFVRKVRMVAYELNVPVLFEKINVREPDGEFLRLSPIGKIPVLVTEQGESIPESDLIARYLCSNVGDTSLFPFAFSLEFERFLAYINAGLDAAAAMIMEHWRAEAMIDQAVIARHRERVARVLKTLEASGEQVLDEKRYLELALATFLGYIDFRKPLAEWREGHPFLSGWYATIVDRPYFKQTIPVQA
jgi:glutathione S-transferase